MRHDRRPGADREIPPRAFVRIAWVLHRALLRLSGGRIGLTRPKAGKKFGMLRLTTVGRRSGQPRVAIVGYYEDGPNLVTLAMNGWAEAEPAWWLNLQAQPDTTVELKDGPVPSAVAPRRARSAIGSGRAGASSATTTTAGRRCVPARPRSSCSSLAWPCDGKRPREHDFRGKKELLDDLIANIARRTT